MSVDAVRSQREAASMELTSEQQAAAYGAIAIGRRIGAPDTEIRVVLVALGLAAAECEAVVAQIQECGHDISERIRDQIHRGSRCRACTNKTRRDRAFTIRLAKAQGASESI